MVLRGMRWRDRGARLPTGLRHFPAAAVFSVPYIDTRPGRAGIPSTCFYCGQAVVTRIQDTFLGTAARGGRDSMLSGWTDLLPRFCKMDVTNVGRCGSRPSPWLSREPAAAFPGLAGAGNSADQAVVTALPPYAAGSTVSAGHGAGQHWLPAAGPSLHPSRHPASPPPSQHASKARSVQLINFLSNFPLFVFFCLSPFLCDFTSLV